MADPWVTERYASLFNVQFQHGFYNADQERCPDFQVMPTPASAAWMKQLGLMFRDRGNGFSIDVPAQRVPGLLSAARTKGSWASLSFVLLLRTPGFVSITALPITTVPTRQSLYASNLETSALCLGSDAQGLDARALHPITGFTLSVQGSGSGTLTVTDISGAPIQPKACVALQAGQVSTLDLSACAFGLYALNAEPASAYTGPASVLLVSTQMRTAGLITLLLSQPDGQGDAQAFPLRGHSMQTVDLRLRFAPRQTYWCYYVVSQGSHSEFLDDLAISGDGTSFQRSAALLPSGEHAAVFTATTPLPLRQRSPYRFSLTGRRHGGDGSRGHVSVSPLPTAPALPVWPSANGDVMQGKSEIYIYV